VKKKEILAHWRAITPRQPLTPGVVPYKHEGSTYTEDGVRITGTQAWIDSVLSRLTELLAHENGTTRLQVSYQESTDKVNRQPTGSFCCYVQVHERGGEAQMANAMASAMFGRETIISKGY